jgi:hypothetical protein
MTAPPRERVHSPLCTTPRVLPVIRAARAV